MRPAPSLGIEQADAHNLRGRILQSEGSPAAVTEYRQALTLFLSLASTDEAAGRPDFHLRYGDLLTNLAALRRERPSGDESRRLLSDAVRSCIEFGRRKRAGAPREARAVLDSLSRVMPELSEADPRVFHGTLRSAAETGRLPARHRSIARYTALFFGIRRNL